MTMEDILALDGQISSILDILKDRIEDAVANAAAMPGVRVISDKPFIATVRSSALISGYNLSPETYIPASQARAVKSAIGSETTLTSLAKKVDSMITERRIRFSNHTVTLNDSTIEALRQVFISDLPVDVNYNKC